MVLCCSGPRSLARLTVKKTKNNLTAHTEVICFHLKRFQLMQISGLHVHESRTEMIIVLLEPLLLLAFMYLVPLRKQANDDSLKKKKSNPH